MTMNSTLSNQQDSNLEASLAYYKAIQTYSTEAMQTDDFDTLLNLSLNAFSITFGFKNILIFEYFNTDEMLYPIAYQGFLGLNSIPTLSFSNEISENTHSQNILQNPVLNHKIASLNLTEGVFCPLFKNKNEFYGLIICGNEQNLNTKLEPFLLSFFTDLSNQVSFYINNFRANERLRLEIVGRKIIEQKNRKTSRST